MDLQRIWSKLKTRVTSAESSWWKLLPKIGHQREIESEGSVEELESHGKWHRPLHCVSESPTSREGYFNWVKKSQSYEWDKLTRDLATAAKRRFGDETLNV